MKTLKVLGLGVLVWIGLSAAAMALLYGGFWLGDWMSTQLEAYVPEPWPGPLGAIGALVTICAAIGIVAGIFDWKRER